jgi:uncharacterized membrane protein
MSLWGPLPFCFQIKFPWPSNNPNEALRLLYRRMLNISGIASYVTICLVLFVLLIALKGVTSFKCEPQTLSPTTSEVCLGLLYCNSLLMYISLYLLLGEYY